MKLSRNKIEIAMAAKKYSIVNLAELYGVSHQRMRVILNSQKVSNASYHSVTQWKRCLLYYSISVVASVTDMIQKRKRTFA